MVRWGRYRRRVLTGTEDTPLQIQRIRCQACGRTQALLPDFLHPYRHFSLALLQRVMMLYLFAGLGFQNLMKQLPWDGPAPSTLREWVGAFAWGAGYLLFDVLRRFVMTLAPEVELSGPAPLHLERSRRATLLKKSYHFWRRGEVLYARKKETDPRLPFSDAHFFPFLLHWLQTVRLPPRLFRPPRLKTTPTTPF